MIKGIQGTTLIDFPGKIASIVFTGGCNFVCPYCYNKQLVFKEELEKLPDISEEEVLNFLDKRKKFIDGVVITGGEPLLFPEKIKALSRKIKNDLKLSVKLDTNGTFPEALSQLLQEDLLDYIAIDLKSSFSNYSFFTQQKNVTLTLKRTVEILRQHKDKNQYEFRTTVIKPLFTSQDINEISDFLQPEENYYLQQLKIIPEMMLNYAALSKWDELLYSKEEIQTLISPLIDKKINVKLRGF
jgi:pyruvate formate lyase activating enzyme